MALFYHFAILLYTFGIRVAALFLPKARKWVAGRRDWRKRYSADFQKKSRVLWVHAASLGEFEQGRPVIEAFRKQFPDWQVVLTFFSPSGYEIRRNYPQADFVSYLPADTPGNATDFLNIIQPDAAIFVKYEFWFNYLTALRERGTPTLLVSALFRQKQFFFQPWGGFWRKGLKAFTHFFVQNQESAQLLQSIGFQNVTVGGDTRIDRVLEIAAAVVGNVVVAGFVAPPSPPVKGGSEIEGIKTTHFSSLKHSKSLPTSLTKPGAHVSPPSTGGLGGAFIAGSSWEADESIFLPILLKKPNWKTIIAPHEPSEKNVQRLLQNPQTIQYSKATPEGLHDAQILVIDNIGMLNTLYRYGTVAYIGGGFGAGIHNTLEPAAFGLPIIFGPKYEKFEEARAFVTRGAAFSVNNSEGLAAVLDRLSEPVFYQQAADAARNFLEENRGATAKVLAFLENRFAKLSEFRKSNG